MIAGASLSKCTYVRRTGIKKPKPRNPTQDVGLPGQRRWPGPLNPRPPGQATWGPPHRAHQTGRRDSPAGRGPGCTCSLPSGPEGREGAAAGRAPGHTRAHPHLPSHEQIKCTRLLCEVSAPGVGPFPFSGQGGGGVGWARGRSSERDLALCPGLRSWAGSMPTMPWGVCHSSPSPRRCRSRPGGYLARFPPEWEVGRSC